jgi:ferrous iron transport protein B
MYQTVALIGPPNVGKSTLFNQLTGLRQKVGNYSGVTVEQRTGRLKKGGAVLVDLPGVWSLAPDSPAEDQRIAVEVLRGERKGRPKPDAVLLILNASQLHRQMALAEEVLAFNLPTMVVINMADVLRARNGFIDPAALARSFGAPVALVSAVDASGLDAIYRKQQLLPILQPSRPAMRSAPCSVSCVEMERSGVYRRPLPSSWTRRIDAVALHPVAGPLLFLMVVLGVFQVIFRVAAPAGTALTNVLTAFGNFAGAHIANEALRSMLVDGIWAGVASITGFLPQILCLFLLIALLEDSGYMARAAAISDRTMRRVGLSGRSFLPLLSAYACAVPAIMATRSIASRRDRLTTILIAPFMTCSARLPLYTLMIASFIPQRNVIGGLLGLQAVTMLGLYALGLVAALATARALNSTVLKRADAIFAIELPEYRMPHLRTLAITLADRARVFLKQVATIILVVSFVVWALGHLPLRGGLLSPIDSSYLAKLGDWMNPLLRPIGLNAHVGVALITAFVARESAVSTLGTIYGTAHVGAALRSEIGIAGAFALLVLFALSLQCSSTIAVVRRETNGWKWPLIQLLYMTVLAYVGALAAYHITLLFTHA